MRSSVIGIPANMIQIQSLINISSDYKYAFYKKCREILASTELWDPNAIYPECIDAAKEVVKQKMGLFNSIGKASIYREIHEKPYRQAFN